MRDFKGFWILLALFGIFTVMYHYYPDAYQVLQAIIFVPVTVFLVGTFLIWLIRYCIIKWRK